jgi:hypothetical protein
MDIFLQIQFIALGGLFVIYSLAIGVVIVLDGLLQRRRSAGRSPSHNAEAWTTQPSTARALEYADTVVHGMQPCK